MTTDKPTTIINRLSFILVGLVAVGSFVLSYASLRETAFTYGIRHDLTWVWPLLVDFAMIVFSLAVVRASLYQERTWWPWLLVALYTVGTIGFNVLHAPDNLTARIVAIVAPVSLFLSFETLMAMLKAEVKRNSLIRSMSQLAQELAQKTQELADFEVRRQQEIEEEGLKLKASLDNELSQLGQEVESKRLELANIESESSQRARQYQERLETMQKTIQSYEQDIEAKREELKNLDSSQVKVYLPGNLDNKQRQELVNRMEQDGLTQKQMAEALGVSVGTIKNIKKVTEVVTNGNGKS